MEFKIAIVIMLSVFVAALCVTSWYGILSRRMGALISGHKGWANFTFWWMFATVGVIEASTWFPWLVDYGPRGAVFWLHIPFAFGLLIVLGLMRFAFNGEKFPKTHKALSYLCYICGLVTVPTGIALVIG